LVLLLCLVFPGLLLAESGTPAYKWSVDQRLRARFDPADMEKRLAAIQMGRPPEKDANVVDGSKNPELLLPTELFNALLKRGFDRDVDARKAWRQKIEPVVSELGIDPDFWPTLAELAAGVIPAATTGRSERTWEEDCKVRHEALAAARKAFGEKSFDRLLYEGVAPGVKVSYRGSEVEKELRDLEKGCRDSSATPDAL